MGEKYESSFRISTTAPNRIIEPLEEKWAAGDKIVNHDPIFKIIEDEWHSMPMLRTITGMEITAPSMEQLLVESVIPIIRDVSVMCLKLYIINLL